MQKDVLSSRLKDVLAAKSNLGRAAAHLIKLNFSEKTSAREEDVPKQSGGLQEVFLPWSAGTGPTAEQPKFERCFSLLPRAAHGVACESALPPPALHLRLAALGESLGPSALRLRSSGC